MKKLIYILFLTLSICSCSTYSIVSSIEQLPVRQAVNGKVVDFSIDLNSLAQDSVGLYGECTLTEYSEGNVLVDSNIRYIFHHMDIGLGYHVSLLPKKKPFIYHKNDTTKIRR